MYFGIETIEKGFEEKRGHYMTVTFDKANKEERTISGVLCKSKGHFLLNCGELDEPVFKTLPHDRIKSVRYNGLIIKPKEKKDVVKS